MIFKIKIQGRVGRDKKPLPESAFSGFKELPGFFNSNEYGLALNDKLEVGILEVHLLGPSGHYFVNVYAGESLVIEVG